MEHHHSLIWGHAIWGVVGLIAWYAFYIVIMKKSIDKDKNNIISWSELKYWFLTQRESIIATFLLIPLICWRAPNIWNMIMKWQEWDYEFDDLAYLGAGPLGHFIQYIISRFIK